MRTINTHFDVVLFCFFLSSLRAMSQPFQMLANSNQSSHNITLYLANRNIVLSNLRNHSSLGNYYSNATAGLSPDIVYGMFLCIGNISRTSCSNCVHSATLSFRDCDICTGTFLFSDRCLVRYTDIPFYALVQEAPATFSQPPNSSSDTPQFFNRTFPEKLDKLILRASSSLSSPIPYFVEDQENVTQLEGSYVLKAMVQCSPDLVPNNCTACLRLAVQNFFKCCGQPPWGEISLPKCVIRYDISALQLSLGNTKGKEGYGRMLIAIMIALIIALMG